jgi:hypothetical protein
MVSYKTIKANSKLTDFEVVREHVIRNIVRNVPSLAKPKDKGKNMQLGYFC